MSKVRATRLQMLHALTLAVVMSAACSSPNTPSGTLGISGSPALGTIGQTAQLGATFTDSKGTADVTSAATWSSSRPGVATVVGGVVTATGPGSTSIVAAYRDAETSIEVFV